MTTQIQLPHKLSELGELGLKALAEVEAMPETYRVAMHFWHMPEGKRCLVCLAGCVIASLKLATPLDPVAPRHFNEETRYALEALDALRSGSVSSAAGALGLPPLSGERRRALNRSITEYREDPAAFRAEFEQLVADLKGAEL